MNERSLWQGMRPHLIRYGDFERVENAAAVGTPDVDYCVRGAAGKIELKYAAMPARETTPVLRAATGLRKEQLVWIRRRRAHGGRVFVLIGADRYRWLIPGEEAGMVNGATASELCAMARYWTGGRVDWDALVRELMA